MRIRRLPAASHRRNAATAAGAAALVAGMVALVPTAPAAASLADVGEPDQHMLDESIVDLEDGVTDLEEAVEEVETTAESGGRTVVTLDSDILFDFDSSDISDSAAGKIREIVGDIPDGASVEVHGHTDSKGDDGYNQELSEDRAQSVADVISDERGDLDLDVEGFGEDEPVAPNESGGEDNPEGRAENRRVEIRYED